MKVEIHGPPKKVITPLSLAHETELKLGLIDKINELEKENETYRSKIKQNNLLIGEMVKELDGPS